MGWKMLTRHQKEQAPESVRNAARGTYRDLGTPGEWTSGASCAEGEETLRESASIVRDRSSRFGSYSEEEAEAHERRADALCIGQPAGKMSSSHVPGAGRSPKKALSPAVVIL